ncbi:MAG: hypothetical protein NTU44_07035 [Bacteroidetes bacterium]|nr:hypothetical protein [Bacteroidota bacterium]
MRNLIQLNPSRTKGVIFLLPLLLIAWTLFLNHLSGPFYLTRIDPEYIYLLNGLNVSVLRFDRIGHFCHPGTPFQLLTGIFIQLTWWIAGQGTIVKDVITRPEFYLSWSSFCLTLLISSGLWWAGKVVYRTTKRITDALVFQAGFFLNIFVLEYASRYLPDRFLALEVLILCVLCFRYLYDDTLSSKRFAVLAGLVMGLSLVTKFNVLPVLLIPVFLLRKWKDRLLYLASCIGMAFICFLPVINHFRDFRGFMTDIAGHSGLYGTGSEQVIEINSLINNIFLIFKENFAFSALLAFSLTGLIFSMVKPPDHQNRMKEKRLLISFLVCVAVGLVFVAKHYRDYYFIPVLTLNTIIFYVLYQAAGERFRFRYFRITILLFLGLLIILPDIPVLLNCRLIGKDSQARMQTAVFIEKNVNVKDFFLVEPTWMSGPLIANGLAYGISYVTHKHVYYNDYQLCYPNILTWEGEDQPLKYLRMINADNESILRSGKDVYTLASPGRNEDNLSRYLFKAAAACGEILKKDTIFINSITGESIYRYRNMSGWSTVREASCGFEAQQGRYLLTDDGKTRIEGEFRITNKNTCNGNGALVLDKGLVTSPMFMISGVSPGDFIELSIKRKKEPSKDYSDGELIIADAFPGKPCNILASISLPISNITENYTLIRLITRIPGPQSASPVTLTSPVSTVYAYFLTKGTHTVLLDDFTYKVYHQRNKED